MNYILFDGEYRDNLLPLTYTKPVADLRIGILTIREKWEKHLGYATTTITEDYLSEKYPMVEMENNVMINASVLPNEELVGLIQNIEENQAIYSGNELIAFYTVEDEERSLDDYTKIEYTGDFIQIKHNWELFTYNGEALEADFNLLTKDRVSAPIP